MKQWQKSVAAVGALAVIIFALFAAYMGSANPKDWGNGNGKPQATNPPEQILTNQRLDMKDSGSNSLDSTATLTGDTNYALTYFAYRNSHYQKLGTSSTGAATIEVQDQDNGMIWCVVKPRSGQNFYVDAATTQAQNDRVQQWVYKDIDGDGAKEFAFQFSVASIEKPIGSNAYVYFYPYFIAYQKPSLSSPSDITSIGTAQVTEYLEWYASFANVKKGYAITKVELVLNTTDTSIISLANMNIPGLGMLSADEFATFRGDTSYTYTWQASPYNLGGANLLTLGTNQLNKFQFTTQLDCTLATSGVYTATLNIYGVDENGAAVAVSSDTVVLSE